MMSQLIKMSLFCDTEMITAFSLDQRTDERTSSLHDPLTFEQSLTSCVTSSRKRSAVSAVPHFLETVTSARVDLSTFLHVHPDQIFCNDYLQPITKRTKTEKSEPPLPTNTADTKPEPTQRPEIIKKPHVERPSTGNRYRYNYGGEEIVRPPYSYRALICAAIFLSEQEELTRQEVIIGIMDMFEVFRIDNREWQTSWRRNVLKRRAPWEKETLERRDRFFRLKYEKLDVGIFARSASVDGYAVDLFTELGRPEKFKELITHVATAKKEAEKRLESTTKATGSPGFQPPSNTSLRLPSSEVTEKITSLPVTSPEMKESCPSLRLPPRPCFNDDSSNDSLQLSVTAVHNDSAHAPTVQTTIPALGTTFTQQNPCFAPTALVYSVPFVSVPQFVNAGSFL